MLFMLIPFSIFTVCQYWAHFDAIVFYKNKTGETKQMTWVELIKIKVEKPFMPEMELIGMVCSGQI